MSIRIYTDGSAVKNVASPNTPAGWGFVVIEGSVGEQHDGGTFLAEAYGKVQTKNTHPEFIGADVGSNNTAELSAIYFALKYIEEHGFGEVFIYSDSQYALGVVFGNWSASKNIQLVANCRRLYDLLELRGILIHHEHIRAHSGFRWNERADKLAYAAAYEELPPEL